MNFITSFIVETIKRLFASKPGYFKVLQIASIVVAIVTGLPEFLTSVGVVLPEALQLIASKAVSIAAVVAALIAQLTVTTAEKNEKNIKDWRM